MWGLREMFSANRISVALCTYNGEKHLTGQLESIAAQKRTPDELIVCDDGSSDETVEIIKKFSRSVSFPVVLHLNEKRLGSTLNFEKAITLCSGELIALCDQDDLWRNDKLARMGTVFATQPEIGLVFSDATLIDENGKTINCRLWQGQGFTPELQRQVVSGDALKVLIKENVVTGATMAFRSDFRHLLSPIAPEWVHDGWIAIVIAVFARVAVINEPLVHYRQHAGQQIGVRELSFRKRIKAAINYSSRHYLTNAQQFSRILVHIESLESGSTDHVVSLLKEKIQHFQMRGKPGRSRLNRVYSIVTELISGRYSRYSRGIQSAAKDLINGVLYYGK